MCKKLGSMKKLAYLGGLGIFPGREWTGDKAKEMGWWGPGDGCLGWCVMEFGLYPEGSGEKLKVLYRDVMLLLHYSPLCYRILY